MSNVVKTISIDFSGQFNPIVFHEEIRLDTLLSLKYISFTTYGDNLIIEFTSNLTGPEDTALDTLISNHNFNNVISPRSIFGEQPGYTKGSIFLTETEGNTYIDITNSLMTHNSEVDLFPSLNVGSSIYIGNDRKFLGLQYLMGNTGIDYGANGEIVWEFGTTGNGFTSIGYTLDNGQEIGFLIHVRDFDKPYYHYNNPSTGPSSSTRKADPFGRNFNMEQITFGYMQQWMKTDVNGMTKFWVRFRITNTLTIIPKIKQISLLPNQMVIGQDGFIQKYGSAIGWEKLSIDWAQFKTSSLFEVPLSTPLYLSSNLSSPLSNNSFPGLLNYGVSLALILPEDFNSAYPLIVRLRYIFDTTIVLTPQIKFKLVVGYSNRSDTVFTGTGPLTPDDEKVYYPIQSDAVPNNGVNTCIVLGGLVRREREMNFVLDLPEIRVTKSTNGILSDTLWLSIIREGSSLDDDYTGNVIFQLIHISYPSSFAGLHKHNLLNL